MRKVLVLALVVLVAFLAYDETGHGLDMRGVAGIHTVTLEVTGSGASSITYVVGVEESQEFDVKLPWVRSFASPNAVPIVVVGIQGAGGGTIGCRIVVNGVVVEENTSQGRHSVVACGNP